MGNETPLPPDVRLRYEGEVADGAIWPKIVGAVGGLLIATKIYEHYETWWSALIAWAVASSVIRFGIKALRGPPQTVKAYSDSVLRHEHERLERRGRLSDSLAYVGGALVVILLVIGWWVGPKTQRQSTRCTITGVTVQADTFILSGDVDFGFRVGATLTNGGPDGNVSVQATLTTSEGEWQRSQRLFIRENQAMPISFAFPEPTINASNVQGRIGCAAS